MTEDTTASNPGTVYLVGAGPGDPDLLTVKAARLVANADVIVHDRLADPEILNLARPGVELIDVGKRPGRGVPQDLINLLLVQLAQAGRTVVRLKGGDPFVFGRGGEEALTLAGAGIECEVIPGVTAGIGVPAALGIPVTHRGLARGVEFSGLVTVGNCADITPSDLLEFYLADEQTKVIGFYIETAKDGRRIFELLRAAKAKKQR